MTPQEAYNQLAFYTLDHKDPYFIHQNIVDSFTAQNTNLETKPITITFALAGLYLCLEKGFSGRMVQKAHMQLAKKRKNWPKFSLPKERGKTTVFDVLALPEGKERNEMIKRWMKDVWDSYRDSQQKIRDLVKEELDI